MKNFNSCRKSSIIKILIFVRAFKSKLMKIPFSKSNFKFSSNTMCLIRENKQPSKRRW